VVVSDGANAAFLDGLSRTSHLLGVVLVEPQVDALCVLPCPVIVVGSAALSEGANRVGARFIQQTPDGSWPAGRALVRELCARAPFALDPRLAADTTLVAHGPLSDVLLYDDARYVWLILVPRRSWVSEVFELAAADRAVLANESHVLASSLAQAWAPDKVNVAAIGNVVRQLHVHHVARWLDDPAWPGPVWGHSPRVARSDAQREQVVEQLLRVPDFARHFHA
jgi:diadenosine tetraphosphate (Ap4A) HIT family hydrolase